MRKALLTLTLVGLMLSSMTIALADATTPKTLPASTVLTFCPSNRVTSLAAKIFGSYEFAAGGGRDFPAGRTMAGFLPAGADMFECGFVRKWDSSENAATPDSDILLSGFGVVANSSALLETWNNLKSRLSLQTSRKGVLHFAARPGFVAGYRDGRNMIAFAYWMINMQGEFKSVPASQLRPLITNFVCYSDKKC